MAMNQPQGIRQGGRSMREHNERPVHKLTVQLIDTYKYINKVYYEKKKAKVIEEEVQEHVAEETIAASSREEQYDWDDENYDYKITIDEVFAQYYIIRERIGKGSFGQVIRAYDTRTGSEVAIKIIKSKKPFALQAKTEIELLTLLKQSDREDRHNIVRLLEHFMYRGHQCLVFEMLSYNLYELLKNTQFYGVSLNLVRKFAKQILTSLSFLARPDVAIIHCDLKPENVLLRHPKRSAIKIIDFGSSCRANRRMYSYIQSRFYRSPEVMLGLQYTIAIDMWSLGCILVEMHTGEPLFSGSDQLDQMRRLIDVLGLPPQSMIDSADATSRNHFFELNPRYQQSNDGGVEDDTETTTTKQTTVPITKWRLKRRGGTSNKSSAFDTPSTSTSDDQSRPKPPKGIASIVGRSIGGPSGRRKGEPGHSERNYDLFLDLVHRMLEFSPTARIKPDEALRHPFLNDAIWASTHLISNGNATTSTPPGPTSTPQHQPHGQRRPQELQGGPSLNSTSSPSTIGTTASTHQKSTTNKRQHFVRQHSGSSGAPPQHLQQRPPYAAALLGGTTSTATDGSSHQHHHLARSHSAPTSASSRRRAGSDASAYTQVAMDLDDDSTSSALHRTQTSSGDDDAGAPQICDAGTQTSIN